MENTENFSSPEGSLNLENRLPNSLPVSMFPKDEIKINFRRESSIAEKDDKFMCSNLNDTSPRKKKKFLYTNKKSDKHSKFSIKRSDIGLTKVRQKNYYSSRKILFKKEKSSKNINFSFSIL